MTDDILLAKLGSIERSLQRIRQVTQGDPQRIDDIDVQDIVVLNLQRAIQAAIDLAAWVISERHLGLPDTLKAHFTLLREQGVISPELCRKLEAMVGFRNIAVHQYQQLDPDVIKDILRHHLTDLEAFADSIRKAARPDTSGDSLP